MATSLSVLCPSGHRVSVRVSPSSPLLQVLEDACRKMKLQPDKHSLRHRGKAVDLSCLFRYSNIPANAHLEMVTADRVSAGEVVVAVQSWDGRRCQSSFPCTTTLWDIVKSVGVVNQERGTPVVVFMSNQIVGESELQKKSLRDLGLTSGRAAMRFLYRGENSIDMSSGMESDSKDSQATQQQSPSRSPTIATPETTNITISDDKISENIPVVAAENMTSENTTHEVTENMIFENTPLDSGANMISENSPLEATEIMILGTAQHESIEIIQSNDVHVGDSLAMEQSDDRTSDHNASLQSTEISQSDNMKESNDIPQSASQLNQGCIPKEKPEPTPQPKPTPNVYNEELCDREVVVYHRDAVEPVQPEEEASDFFTVTQSDLLLMQKDLKKQVSQEDAPLLTSAMRQVLKDQRFASYSRTVIRVSLPDRWVLQAVFRPDETLRALVTTVRAHLADPTIKFHLYTTPPKTILRGARKSFLEAGLVPTAFLHLGLEQPQNQANLLSDTCLSSAVSALDADIVLARHSPDKRSAESAAISKTVPKWFKLGK